MNETRMSRKKAGRRRGRVPGGRSLASAKMQIAAMAVATACALGVGPSYAKFDIPTGANPSPMFGATPFSQKMLMFEEFGPQPLPDPTTVAAHFLPDPAGCNGPADPASYTNQLDSFLSEPLYPAPQRTANVSLPNPWGGRIGGCIGRPVTGVIEGRPPGEDFAHQRWAEFDPTAPGAVYFQTAMAGSRPNGGIRDSLQMHHYQFGEFGPGGLYNDTTGTGLNGTTKGIQIRFHPRMPLQDPIHLWTFDGTLPPKLLMAPYESTILLRHYNALPINAAANGGFGEHTITTHEHNGHNPAESDGFAGAYFFPGEFYDYRWPMVLAGHDTINTDKSDPRTGAPACADPRPGVCTDPGGIRHVAGNWHETMSTHWFHDHMLDATAQNVYKGNAAMMNYYSAIDRGREPASVAEANGTNGYGCNYANPDNANLCLPSGSDLDWGNRSYDVNLVVADKAFDSQGQLWYNTLQTDGFIGDVATVNFLYKPYLDVRARKYRFRILNGSVSRYWKIALVDSAGNQVPFYMIGNDGNIMEHAVPFPNVQSPEGLPSQGIAERYDIVVDFSKFKDGDKLYFVNLLEHEDGKTPKQAIPLAQVLSGAYSASGCPKSCDPVVGKFMEVRVHSYTGTDLSMNPADYVEGKKTMIPLPGFTAAELANAKERTFSFNRGGDVTPWTISTDGGQSYNASSPSSNGGSYQAGVFSRVSAVPNGTGVDGKPNPVEIWHIRNGGQGWSHPVHIHFEEGQILQRGGVAPPLWEKGARKDMYRIGPMADTTDSVDVAIRVREFLGTYVEHCHNTTHEDNAMLLRWDSQHPGQTVFVQSPWPTWDGVTYIATNTSDVPSYETGQQTDFLTKVAAPIAANDTASTSGSTPVTVAVLDNDTCVGGCDAASLTIGTSPTNGSAVRNADGTVSYTSSGSFTGTDSFTYTVRDTTTGTQVSNPATVAVTVSQGPPPPASKPVAVADTAKTTQGTPVGIPVTANDTNCSATTPCTVAIVGAAVNGSAASDPLVPGSVKYTPNAAFTGTDTFSYTDTNAGGTSNTASVTVTVDPNPVTDVVTISSAALARNGSLNVSGTVSRVNGAFAPNVQVFQGEATGSTCGGTNLGTASVKGGNGGWSFSFRRPAASPRSVCVQSVNGGVAAKTY